MVAARLQSKFPLSLTFAPCFRSTVFDAPFAIHAGPAIRLFAPPRAGFELKPAVYLILAVKAQISFENILTRQKLTRQKQNLTHRN